MFRHQIRRFRHRYLCWGEIWNEKQWYQQSLRSSFPVGSLFVPSHLPIIRESVLTYLILDLPPLCQIWLRSACLSPAVVLQTRSVWHDSWLICIFPSHWLRKLPGQWNTPRQTDFSCFLILKTRNISTCWRASTKPQTLCIRAVLFPPNLSRS